MVAAINRRNDEERIGADFDKRVAELGAVDAIRPLQIHKQDANRVRFSYFRKDGNIAFSRWYNKGEDAMAYCRRWHISHTLQ